MTEVAEKFVHSERSVLDALRKRHAPKRSHGNGPEWAFVEHVRDSAGFNASRTIDAMALGLWPSRGLELHGFEVKVSRADFRREVADVAKMDAFAKVLDRFWVVAPKGVVPPVELPATWGLLEVGEDGVSIRQKVAAPLLTDVRVPIPRDFLVPLLRAAGAVVQSRPEDLVAEYERGFASGKSHAAWNENSLQRKTEQVKELTEALAEIDAAFGTNLTHTDSQTRMERVGRVAGVVRSVLSGDDVELAAQQKIDKALDSLVFAQRLFAYAHEDIERQLRRNTL
jgi:hypothetical protein